MNPLPHAVTPGQARKARPILFSAPMVRALLAGTKTQTRRIIKLDRRSVLGAGLDKAGFDFSIEHAEVGDLSWVAAIGGDAEGVQALRKYQQLNVPVRHPDDKGIPFEECGRERIYCPYGSPGCEGLAADTLWVKETFHEFKNGLVIFRADQFPDGEQPPVKWKPSIFMRRALSRITLEVVSVRVERVQDVSEEDAEAEGIQALPSGGYGTVEPFSADNTARDAFKALWDSINAKREGGKFSWASNPWVWVLDFTRLERAGWEG